MNFVSYDDMIDLMPKLAEKIAGGSSGGVTKDVLYKWDGTALKNSDILQLTNDYTYYDEIIMSIGYIINGSPVALASNIMDPSISNAIQVAYWMDSSNHGAGMLTFNGATATLNYLSIVSSDVAVGIILIEGKKFNNSSSSEGGVTAKVLWDGNKSLTIGETLTLADDVANYDYVYFEKALGGYDTKLFTTDTLTSGATYLTFMYNLNSGLEVYSIAFSNDGDNILTVTDQNLPNDGNVPRIVRITGFKL